MRTPTERLAEIHKRADARITAIQKRNRTIAGACTTLIICLMIGLSAHRILSVSNTPPLVPPEQTTICNAPTTTVSANTALSAVASTASDSTTTSTFLPSATDDAIYTTVTTTVSISADSSTTSLLSTTTLPISATVTTTQTVVTRTSATTVPTRTTLQAVTTDRFTTTVTVPTTFTTKAPVTATTTKPSTVGSGNSEPSRDDPTTLTTDTTTVPLTTTTDDRTLAGDGITAPQEPTTTTGNWGWDDVPPPQTPPAIPDVIFSTGSAEDVEVGDIITVDVTVSDEHFMVYGCINLFFDPNALELLPVSDNPDSPYVNDVNMDIMPENCTWTFSTPSPGTLEFVFLSSAFCGSAQGGTMFTLTFRVLEGIGESTDFQWYIPFMLSGIAFDGTPNDYDTPYRFESGIISVKKD